MAGCVDSMGLVDCVGFFGSRIRKLNEIRELRGIFWWQDS